VKLEGTQSPPLILNPPDYKESIINGEDVYIQFSVFTPEVESFLVRILHRLLQKYDFLYYKEMLLTVIRELISNAIKANVKRLYFKIKNLDIRDRLDYRDGMNTFKEDVYCNDNDYLDKLKSSNLFVKVLFKPKADSFSLYIINNTQILKEELIKVNARIKKAFKYNDIAEAFHDVLDDSEGAGLGLIMAIMLFKNSGISLDSFKISAQKGRTISSINISQRKNQLEVNAKVTDEILKEVEKIPSFPENVILIQRLIHNPKSTIKEISESIKRDLGLTTSILKLANSAGYITLNKIKSIEEAVKLIGIRSINILLIATGVHKIMDSRYKKFESIWKNSYKAAFYAQKISIRRRKTKLGEFSFLAAFLSDIGKIVLLTINPEVTQRIVEITGIKNIEGSNILEEISLGISHSTLGKFICKKWKFNDPLIHAVENHHSPHLANEKYKELIYTVYLVYIFTEIEERKHKFETIDEDVLDYFNLLDKDKFETLHEYLISEYEKHSMIPGS